MQISGAYTTEPTPRAEAPDPPVPTSNVNTQPHHQKLKLELRLRELAHTVSPPGEQHSEKQLALASVKRGPARRRSIALSPSKSSNNGAGHGWDPEQHGQDSLNSLHSILREDRSYLQSIRMRALSSEELGQGEGKVRTRPGQKEDV